MAHSISLSSLLETHDQPFAIIDASLTIQGVNKAYEQCFHVDRAELIGKACCHVTGDERNGKPCRHRLLFQDFEPYRSVHERVDTEGRLERWQVRGVPLIDADNVIYLGETILPLGSSVAVSEEKMAGNSPAFQQMRQQLDLAAASLVPVLLQGETGTGKEVASDYIHRHSARQDKSLVVVDCTVLGEDLFESEVFGHEKGAFTGAAGVKRGLFELAHQGTLFLDEIGELPISQQPKLLRALESGSFRRVGGSETKFSDVRVISATNRNLADMVRRGEFREDLFYRLAVFQIQLPPLRARRDDIGPIAARLLDQIGRCVNREYRLSATSVAKLMRHDFPGNVRELRNILQLAATMAQNGIVEADHIFLPERLDREPDPAPVRTATAAPSAAVVTPSDDMNPLEAMEIAYIQELIRKHEGSRRAIAAEMNISERTLYRKLKRYQLND